MPRIHLIASAATVVVASVVVLDYTSLLGATQVWEYTVALGSFLAGWFVLDRVLVKFMNNHDAGRT